MSAKKQKNEELEILQQQIIELTEALQRERADIINIRRRHEEQVSGLKTLIKIQLVEELLPVIDNFERALGHTPVELKDNDFIKGVNGVVKQFESTLSQMGVKKIKTIGEVFNPEFHEAITAGESDAKEDIVTKELQAGYVLGDKVIRHATVEVNK